MRRAAQLEAYKVDDELQRYLAYPRQRAAHDQLMCSVIAFALTSSSDFASSPYTLPHAASPALAAEVERRNSVQFCFLRISGCVVECLLQVCMCR